SRRGRDSAKRPRKELTYCPIYGFKPCVICAKGLTPALFCCSERFSRAGKLAGRVYRFGITLFPSRGKAMDSGGLQARDPLAKEQETVHD
ncbi:MAG: hypothetical protein LBE06_05400, partial [Azoarcus sp.]|nr:hypothetical protein [Azoarcus sp.]